MHRLSDGAPVYQLLRTRDRGAAVLAAVLITPEAAQAVLASLSETERRSCTVRQIRLGDLGRTKERRG